MQTKGLLLLIVLASLLISCPATAQAETPDPPKPEPAETLQTPAPTPTTQPKVQEPAAQTSPNEQTLSQIKLELAERDAKLYKEVSESLRGSVNTVVNLVVGFITVIAALIIYLGFKNRGQYKDAVKSAQRAADDAREWEKEAQERLREIDAEKDKLFKQIEEKANDFEERRKESVQGIQDEGKKQRKASELWSKGMKAVESKDFKLSTDCFEKVTELLGDSAGAYCNWGNALSDLAKFKGDEKLFEQSFEKYEKAADIKPDDHEVYNNWGTALSDLAELKGDEKLFEQSFEKYKKAVEIKPDYHEAYDNWGNALLVSSYSKTGTEKETPLEEAIGEFLKAESIKAGFSAYNLACAYALLKNKAKCLEWLKIGEEYNTLETREEAMGETDFDNVRNEEWFGEIRWKGEA